MVVVMKPGTRQQDIDALVSRLKELDLDVGITNGVGCTILGLVGDTTAVDMDKIAINPHVERVMRVQEPYKKANRKFHPEDSVVDVPGFITTTIVFPSFLYPGPSGPYTCALHNKRRPLMNSMSAHKLRQRIDLRQVPHSSHPSYFPMPKKPAPINRAQPKETK